MVILADDRQGPSHEVFLFETNSVGLHESLTIHINKRVYSRAKKESILCCFLFKIGANYYQHIHGPIFGHTNTFTRNFYSSLEKRFVIKKTDYSWADRVLQST